MQIREEAFQYYFYFMQERMNVFWKKYEGQKENLSEDEILRKYKFTNVYRAQDRVSQYLIRNVIYLDRGYSEVDKLLRIIIFKVFNNIDTWLYLEDRLGSMEMKTFDVKKISVLLSERIKVRPIFSAAYMMTGSHSKYNEYKSKHEKWLWMLKKELLDGGVLNKISRARSLEQVYNYLRSCSFIGDFLAYQYAIDFNYSDVIDFDENSFVKAGIGSIRGIKKCFPGAESNSFEKYIRYTQEHFFSFQNKYGFNEFKNLFGREPTLIDLQNCFCETDKYLRVKMPELQVDNIRIKQKYSGHKEILNFFFPPKWGINNQIKPCSIENSKESTLF